MIIDRRNKRSVQIFLLLITFLISSGWVFWYYSNPVDEVPDYFPPEVKVHQKTEREIALEKVRQLQQNGFGNGASETYYDDQSKKSVAGNPDNSGFENARVLFQKLNSTIVRDGSVNENGEKMTADSFYDEKLKQKQEEDQVDNPQPINETGEKINVDTSDDDKLKQTEESVNKKQDESLTADEDNFNVIPIPRNETDSLDIIGKSEAVQSWLAKQGSVQKSLSEVESSLQVDQAAQLSQRRNPKFEQVDSEIERLQNQIHQFKFVQ